MTKGGSFVVIDERWPFMYGGTKFITNELESLVMNR